MNTSYDSGNLRLTPNWQCKFSKNSLHNLSKAIIRETQPSKVQEVVLTAALEPFTLRLMYLSAYGSSFFTQHRYCVSVLQCRTHRTSTFVPCKAIETIMKPCYSNFIQTASPAPAAAGSTFPDLSPPQGLKSYSNLTCLLQNRSYVSTLQLQTGLGLFISWLEL